MDRGQPSEEEQRTTRVVGPILIDSIYIDLGVLVENKDNQHRGYDVGDVATNGTCATAQVDDAGEEDAPFFRRTRSKSVILDDGTTANHGKETKHSDQPRRRRKARKMRSLKEIYATTECISQTNNAQGANNEDGDVGEIHGNHLNESLAPTAEIMGQQPVATDDADLEAVRMLLSLRDP